MDKERSLTIEEMDSEIKEFCAQYAGTSIGQSIYRKRVNTYDTDFDGIREIWEEVQDA